MSDTRSFILPTSITTPIDVSRVLREIHDVDDFLDQASIRKPGVQPSLPKTSRLLDELLNTNKLNILVEKDRELVQQLVGEIKAKAPVLHISFSADPTPTFLQKLVAWLRQEIHPLVLIQVGLQPSIGAGCIVRTNNKHFDFSLRQNLRAKRELLMQEISGSKG
ncbi:MAG TPA: hypothetical protein VLG25_01260 [Patescibacteria group bacterium]|nr:hypothetical protein [Patescibacteria group bacterium]